LSSACLRAASVKYISVPLRNGVDNVVIVKADDNFVIDIIQQEDASTVDCQNDVIAGQDWTLAPESLEHR